ncbi:MAG: efflux RND transporter periplasmic adaptor subunit [Burkholderiales bacterium]
MKSGTGWVVLALLAGLSACGKSDKAAGPGGMPAPDVTLAAAETRPVAETQEYPARLEAVDQVVVRSRVTGYIQSVHFQQGAEVRKGDALVTIDPRPFEARVHRAEAEIGSLRSRADLARVELARAEKLMASGAGVQRDVDERGAQVRDLDAAMKGAQAALDAARLDLSFTRVLAPISGRVGKAEITAGNLVQAEAPESAALTSIVSINPIYVAFEVDERVFVKFGLAAKGRSKAGLPVEVALAGEDGFPHKATLTFVDNRLDPGTGSVKARATLENADGTLTPGLFARVRISDPAGARDTVVIPELAAGTDQDRRFVFVVGAEKKAEYRPVALGPTVDGKRVVLSGLKPGENVIVNGLMRVRPGVPVNVKTEGAAAPAGAAKK